MGGGSGRRKVDVEGVGRVRRARGEGCELYFLFPLVSLRFRSLLWGFYSG